MQAWKTLSPILESALNHSNEEIRSFAIGVIRDDTIQNIPNFIEDLSFALWSELTSWRDRFKFETIHGFDLRCIPWYGQIKIGFLSSQEDFALSEAYSEDWYSKWRLNDLPYHGDQIKELGKWMLGEYEKSQKSLTSLKLFLEACTSAIKSSSVQQILKDFKLSENFQITVFHPSPTRPQRNYYTSQ